jgi:excisionase family DNA binding protein
MTNIGEQERVVATVIEEPGWVPYSEAQRFSGLGRTKLWELISTGEVEAAKIGRAVRISLHSLDAYMRRNSYADIGG